MTPFFFLFFPFDMKSFGHRFVFALDCFGRGCAARDTKQGWVSVWWGAGEGEAALNERVLPSAPAPSVLPAIQLRL